MKLLPFLLLVLACSPSLAQQTSVPGKSRYAPRTSGYTSLDNPYAPGGIYDPYRSNRPARPAQDEDNSAMDLDAESSLCTDNHLASDISISRQAGGSQMGFGNGTKSIGSLNRASTNGYEAVRHCGGTSLAAGSRRHKNRKPGLGMNDAMSGNLRSSPLQPGRGQ